MNEPLTDKEIEEYREWANGDYPADSPMAIIKSLIVTVESLKEDKRILGKIAEDNI
uniref:Uncharacterized protein n=1 Tax=uncultured marine virus TaxID=186617 RepID=A0A0F7L484_9VIRU|nr:hypothetical protein [uncultured marine virus]